MYFKATLLGKIFITERDLKGSFKLVHNKFHETNYFGAQISKTRLKLVGAKVVFLCIILSEHKKQKLSARWKKRRKRFILVKPWLVN